MKTNIENLTVFCDRGTYGYTVRYKSGMTKTKITGSMVVLPDSINRFMVSSPYNVSHDDTCIAEYHEVIYYARDIRTQSPHLF